MGPAEGFPAAAVDPADGALYVVWKDSRFRHNTLTRFYSGILTSRAHVPNLRGVISSDPDN